MNEERLKTIAAVNAVNQQLSRTIEILNLKLLLTVNRMSQTHELKY